MKKIFYTMITVALFRMGIPSVQAQTTGGTDFWLTFGLNSTAYGVAPTYEYSDLQVRIVNDKDPITVYIVAYEGGPTINTNKALAPYEVWTVNIPCPAFLPCQGNGATTSKSIRIRTLDNKPFTVYALNQFNESADGTNILPVSALSTDYRLISYTPCVSGANLGMYDAYAVISPQNGTNVYENGSLVATLGLSQVYYKTNINDMTGYSITSNNPIAVFALNMGTQIPDGYSAVDHLMCQMAPVNTWGKEYFVPVSHLSIDKVRIVASQNGTVVSQTGGNFIYSSSGTYTINAGQYLELDALQSANGCYITATQPVGVCAYLASRSYTPFNTSDPAQAWLPPMEQLVEEALIAPFKPNGATQLIDHYALIMAPTLTAPDTKVSINGGAFGAVSGGIWRPNAAAKMSYYIMPLTGNPADSYRFTNDAGIILMAYGTGYAESYYYLGYSAMRNLKATFYADNIIYTNMFSHLYCSSPIEIEAQVIGMATADPLHLRWWVDGIEIVAEQNHLTWETTLSPGQHEIEMWVKFLDGTDQTISGTLNVGAHITTSVSPSGSCSASGDGCYAVGETATVTATPCTCYDFVNWTDGGTQVSTNPTYSFTVTDDVDLVANFNNTCSGCTTPAEITITPLTASVCYATGSYTVNGTLTGSTTLSVQKNGGGASTPVTVTAGNFSYTYNFVAGDEGQTITLDFTAQPTDTNCSPETESVAVTVTANNTINLTSAAGTDGQTVCINTAIVDITYATTGATGATVSGLPAGVNGTWASNAVTINGTPTASGTFNYTVKIGRAHV